MEDFINVDLIKFYMWENKLTKKKFCKLCQISTQTLNKILNQKNFRIDVLPRIAKVLKVRICDLFLK